MFHDVLHAAEEWGKKQEVSSKKMRTFEQSQKSKKTVASMIESRKDLKPKETKKLGKENENYISIILASLYRVLLHYIILGAYITLNTHVKLDKCSTEVTKDTGVSCVV